MKDKIILSVVVPTFNSKKFIEKNIKKLSQKLKYIEKKHEIIIVNDGSTDETANILKNLELKKMRVRLVNLYKNYGKGAAVRKGIEISKGENIIFIDCDLPYFNSIKILYNNLKIKNYNLVISTREKNLEKKFYKRKNFFLRKFYASLINSIVRGFIVSGYTDTQAGLKGFKRKIKNKILTYKTNGFLFDIEILRTAKKNNIDVKKIFVKDKPEDYSLNYVTNIKIYISVIYDLFYILLLVFLKRI